MWFDLDGLSSEHELVGRYVHNLGFVEHYTVVWPLHGVLNNTNRSSSTQDHLKDLWKTKWSGFNATQSHLVILIDISCFFLSNRDKINWKVSGNEIIQISVYINCKRGNLTYLCKIDAGLWNPLGSIVHRLSLDKKAKCSALMF